MTIILQQLAFLYIFFFLGWLFGKRKPGLTSGTGVLSFLLVNLFLPAKTFNSFSKNFTVEYISQNYKSLFFSLGFLLFTVGFALLVAKLVTPREYEQRVFRYSLTLSNYAYMGYVLVENLFGAQALTSQILFSIPFAFYTYTFGYAMLTSKGNLLKKLINPIIAALLLGMVAGLTGLQMPDLISQLLSSCAGCVGPLSMVMTGLVLSGFSLRELIFDKGTYIIVAVRLLVLPAITFGICQIPLLRPFLRYAVLMASMPCGLNTIVFPKLVGEDCRPGARLALLSHLFSIATLPLWLALIR